MGDKSPKSALPAPGSCLRRDRAFGGENPPFYRLTGDPWENKIVTNNYLFWRSP